MTSVCARLVVRGLVQGVGFRYWCYRQATDLGVTGWVKNLPDGSVAIEIEGDRSLVEELVGAVRVGPSHGSVTDVSLDWQKFTGKYKTFDIAG